MSNPASGAKTVILVIDDEPTVADAVKIILEDSGYVVVTAITGRSGFERACECRIDLAIVDLQLPDMSGLDVLSAVREREPDARVIIITAHGSPDIDAEAARRGAFIVLPKPFHSSDLLKQVAAALTR
jgi:DNA-binding NtrC family response regulator